MDTEKLPNWEHAKYPAVGSTHAPFIFYKGKIVLNDSQDQFLTAFDINKKELSHIALPTAPTEAGYHLLQDFKSGIPYLIKYLKGESVDVYRFQDLNIDNLFLIGMLGNDYPFSVYDTTFFSWKIVDGERAVAKKFFNL